VYGDEWVLTKQSALVSLYTKETVSGYKDILVKTQVKATPMALVHLLNDLTVSTQWIHNSLDVQQIQQLSKHERIMKTVFSAPWPIKNRDMVTLSNTIITPGSVRIEITDQGHLQAKDKNYVRMQQVHGLWLAKATKDQTLLVSYEGGGTPGGNIPQWMANKEMTNSLFRTFENLHEFIILEQYQRPLNTSTKGKQP
jgi:hypothetical protein